MLVLSRQRDETIVLDFAAMTDAQLFALRDNPVRITTVDIRGDKVRTGISAIKTLAVHREEVWEAIRREAAAARQVDGVKL